METRERLAAAAALARLDPKTSSSSQLAPPAAEEVASDCGSWGVSAQLKPHQTQGVAWLIKCYIRGVNVILGDEMGLGKTLQAIVLISYLKFQRGIAGPFLILCPLSVIDGWLSEFIRFSSKLRVIKYVGHKDERAKLARQICDYINGQPATLIDDPDLPFDVLLTTYDLAMIDMPFLSRFHWRYAIIDEAQRLKNPSSVLYKTLEEEFMIPRRLLLTGTPVQNNLSELWALLHFCMPFVFDSLENFLSSFAKIVTPGDVEGRGQLKLLKSILNTFMLRRTKAGLVKSRTLVLPTLSEVTLLARLAPLQKQIYLSVLKKELPKVMARAGTVVQSLQNIVVQLRKACSHPYLFNGVEPEPFQEGEHLIEASGKLIVLDKLLEGLYAEKHRALIYCQMARTLDILQDYLEFRGYKYERLDGSVRAEERFVAARKFNASSEQSASMDTESPFVFLLTTRAGGVGLNLTAADTVIFYEQDWNPQADKQALQRAHRIGQISPVLAINLVAKNTIDEVILSRAKKKLKLTHDIIGSSNSELEVDDLIQERPSDLQSLIIFGLHKLDSSEDSTEGGGHAKAAAEVQLLVKEALKQRNKETLSMETSLSTAQQLEENIFSFEGRDFSVKKRRDEADEQKYVEKADEDILGLWIKKLGNISQNISHHELEGRQSRKHHLSTGTDSALEVDQEAKRRKTEQRKQAKWEAMGYKSMAMHDPGELAAGQYVDNDHSNVHFVFGDCTKPSMNPNEKAIILSIVDNSGKWGSGGMFHSLDKLSKEVQNVYTRAKAAGDLHVGDLHLLPLHGCLKLQFF